MKKVTFEDDEDTVSVSVDDKDYGYLEFDSEQDAWVLWPDEIDDGITYFSSLAETEQRIREELEEAEREEEENA